LPRLKSLFLPPDLNFRLHALFFMVLLPHGGCVAPRPIAAPARLIHTIDKQAANCPDSQELKRAVQALLGYDPWVEPATREVHARVEVVAGALRAKLHLQQGSAAPIGSRTLEARLKECRELTDAMALAISLAIDPLAVPRTPPRSSPRKPRLRGAKLRLDLGGHLALGAAPEPTGGGRVALSLAWSRFSLGVGGRLDAPASAQLQAGRVSAHFVGGSMEVCGQYRWWFGCGILAIGALRGEGAELRQARTVWLPLVAPGLRSGAALHITPRFGARLFGELDFTALGARFMDVSEKVEFWQTPTVSGLFGVDLFLLFL
jgi:hypothetical protein